VKFKFLPFLPSGSHFPSKSGLLAKKMATLGIEPSNRVLAGSQALPSISFPSPVSESILPVDPCKIVTDWTSSFTRLIGAGQTDVSKAFLEDSYWRDLLCLTWNFHTLHGSEGIKTFFTRLRGKPRIKSLSVDDTSDFRRPQITALDFQGKHKCVQSFVKIDTDVGRAWGLLRLLPDNQGLWKCYTLLTVLQELKGHEEKNHERRPRGTDNVSRRERLSWKDMREREQNLEGYDPAVLIVGM
jgi:hypothetical protein